MGPSIVYSERTNEELEELFQSVINDESFIKFCSEQLKKSYSTSKQPAEGEIVHEINLSVSVNVEVDQDNPDIKLIRKTINFLPAEEKKNRFSNLHLSDDVDRYVQMHDYLRHSRPSAQTKVDRRTDPRRRATISAIFDEKNEYEPALLEKIVEQQLEAAQRAGSMKEFNPISKSSVPTSVIHQTKFVRAPTFPTKDEVRLRHRVDHIEYPKQTINRITKRPMKPGENYQRPMSAVFINDRLASTTLTTPLKGIKRQFQDQTSASNQNLIFLKRIENGRVFYLIKVKESQLTNIAARLSVTRLTCSNR